MYIPNEVNEITWVNKQYLDRQYTKWSRSILWKHKILSYTR